jgi:hypothetical protein
MSEFFAAVFGDVHLKDRIYRNRPMYGDPYFVFNAAIDIAIENEVKVVILPGDILDKQSNNSKPIACLKAGLDKLDDAGIQVAYIQGQHCMADPPWPSVSKNAVHLHRNSIEVDGYTITGIDFQAKENLQGELSWVSETLKAEPAKTILVMHQVWSPWMPDFTLPQGHLDDVSGFIPELGLLVTGDLHEWKNEITSEGLVALSPGSMCMQSISEPEDKYVTLLGPREHGMEKVRLPTRPFIDWPFLGTVSDIEDVIREFDWVFGGTQSYCERNSLPDEMCSPLVRFRYDHSLSGDIHRLEKLVRGRGHIFWKELAPTVSDGELSAYELGVQAGLGAMQTMGSVLSSVECDEAVREVAERLLSEGNPEEELQRWRKEQVEADTQRRLVDEYERS